MEEVVVVVVAAEVVSEVVEEEEVVVEDLAVAAGVEASEAEEEADAGSEVGDDLNVSWCFIHVAVVCLRHK